MLNKEKLINNLNFNVMKKKIFIVVFILSAFYSVSSYAQFNPYTEKAKMLSVGIGASGWGIPLYGRYEQAVADNITIGGTLSFQSKTESYTGYKWKHTIVGLNGRGSYHFNELLKAPDIWDFYAGASLGYFFWNTEYNGSGTDVYSGSGDGGFSIGAHVGGRYFVNDKIAINLELGGGTVLGGATLGVTFML
jgi:outer membrane immunogenic protein